MLVALSWKGLRDVLEQRSHSVKEERLDETGVDLNLCRFGKMEGTVHPKAKNYLSKESNV